MTLKLRLFLSLLPALLVLFVMIGALSVQLTQGALDRAFRGGAPVATLSVLTGDVTVPSALTAPGPVVRTLPASTGAPDTLPFVVRRDGDRLLLVSASLGDVEALPRRLVWTYLGWGGLLLLVATGVGAWGVSVSLRPLATLAHEVERRTPDDLVALDDPGVPELRPAVRALNGLLRETREALRRRERQEEAARRFAFGASHELRNPLAAVRNYLEVLRRAPGHERALDGALREARRTEAVLDALLTLARLEGRGRPAARDVDLAEVTADVDGAPPAPPATVCAEPDLLALALGNLVANARRHGGGDVRVETERDGAGTWIWVLDDGPGFPEAVRDRAFEPFVKTGSGTGLGLAIVAAVAHVHGGRVRAETREGGGARVGLWLPAPEGRAEPPPRGEREGSG